MENQGSGYKLVGGALCLDFSNTIDHPDLDDADDLLASYGALVSWSHLVGIVDDAQAEQLRQSAAMTPTEAAAALKRALTLRDAIYRVFSAAAADQPPASRSLNIVNRNLGEAFAQLWVVYSDDGYHWSWHGTDEALDWILWPVVRSAAELLNSDQLSKVRECAKPDCGWLFLDLSRNHSRRWCDMESCGNKIKARRHYQRQVGSRAEGN